MSIERTLKGLCAANRTQMCDLNEFATMKTNNDRKMIPWWSMNDDGVVAVVHGLPGCMAQGKTRLESIQDAGDAIASWINTAKEYRLTFPQPRGRLLHA